MSYQHQLFDRIHEALSDGALRFLRDHENEHLYGLFFIMSPEGYYALIIGATKENLVRTAEQYALNGYKAKNGDTIEQLCKLLRWSGSDDGWYGLTQNDTYCDHANDLLLQAWELGFLEYFDGQLSSICLNVLRQLDRKSIFNPDGVCSSIILGITFGFFCTPEVDPWVQEINPYQLYEKFKTEIDIGFQVEKNIISPYD
jgi:Domain of unknown function (DUF4303)